MRRSASSIRPPLSPQPAMGRPPGDARVPEGAITALVGPNGAGKSTADPCLLGFERPDEGRILVTGIDPDPRSNRSSQRDRLRPAGRVALPELSRSATTSTSLGWHGRRSIVRCRSRTDPRRRTVRASAIADLSGGEQAQVSLALALGTRAPLLLLDEPLSSLDPLARRDFLTTLVDDVRAGARPRSSRPTSSPTSSRPATALSCSAAAGSCSTSPSPSAQGGVPTVPATELRQPDRDRHIRRALRGAARPRPRCLTRRLRHHSRRSSSAISGGPRQHGQRGSLMLTSARLTLKQHRFEVGAAVLGALVLGGRARSLSSTGSGTNVPADASTAWLSAGGGGAGGCAATGPGLREDQRGRGREGLRGDGRPAVPGRPARRRPDRRARTGVADRPDRLVARGVPPPLARSPADARRHPARGAVIFAAFAGDILEDPRDRGTTPASAT